MFYCNIMPSNDVNIIVYKMPQEILNKVYYWILRIFKIEI